MRCPKCHRKNQIPVGAESKARCGACRAPLTAGGGRASAAPSSPAVRGSSGTSETPGIFGAPGSGGPGSPWGPAGPAGAASPWGPAGLGGAGGPWGGGGDASGARMRQTRRTGRTPSTSATGPGPSGFGGASDPRTRLVQRWDELLRLVPADMGLTAALDQGGQRPASDPISWLSAAAGVPREELEQVRHLRNSLATNRLVPDRVIANALETVDRALGVVGHMRLPE